MNKRNLAVHAAMCFLLMAGCVTTTTGVAPPAKNDGDAAELNYQLGARYYQNGNFELARDRLLLSIELDPSRAITHSTLALAYEALGNPRLATAYHEKAVRTAPRNFDVQNTYAIFLCKQRKFDVARKNFDKAAGHPENDNAEVTLTNAGVCFQQKPDLALAENYFRKALERRSSYAEALLQMCLLKYETEDYLGSRAFLQRFMSSNKTTASVLYLGSEIESKLGDDRARAEFVNQLLREFPTSPEAKKVLGTG